MKILAIDTSSAVCGTAILENDKPIDENILDNGKTHSENLMPLMDTLLKRNHMDIKDIDLLACSVGPGSFTGIRIGIATVKPIAEVLNIPIVSITSLETLAMNTKVSEKETIVSLLDARNNQVYAGAFNDQYKLQGHYMAENIKEVLDKIKNYNAITFVGDGAILHKEIIESQIPNAKFASNHKQSAIQVGKLGYQKFLEKQDICTADTLIPIYLRKSQAERLKNKEE